MSLRIRRGTNSQRTGITFDLGEIVYTTDTQKLYIGDGVTAGGKNLLETSAGNGFTFNPTTQQIDFAIGNLNLNTAQVTEGSNLYFTTERAQDAVGAALVAGNAFNTGVTFTYDDANNRITAVSTGGLTTVSSDTNPSLGGNLNTGAFNISGNGSITAGTITATNLGGNLNTGAFNISGTGSITAGTITATTGLGANLPLNLFGITGTGNINISGRITTSEIATTLTSVASGVCTLASVTGLTVGMPIVFNYVSQNSGVLGNIIPGIVFYILTINTGLNQITISRSRGGGQFATGTASNTTMKVTANGIDTGIMSTNVMNINSMLVFRDMTYPVDLRTYQIAGLGSYFVFGNATTPNNFVFNTDTTDQPFTIRGVTNGFSGNQPQLTLSAGRGTLASPQIIQNGDSIGLIRFNPYTGTSQMAGYANGGFITGFVSDSNITSAKDPVSVTIAIGNIADPTAYTTFAPGGVVTVPVLTKNLVNEVINFITVASSATYVLSTTVTNNIIITSGSYTATLTFPNTGLRDGQLVKFTVAATASAFTLTLALTAGTTLVGTFAGAVATSASTATTYSYIYRTSNTSWYRV